MTTQKAIAIFRAISENGVEIEELTHFLNLLGKLSREDALKVMWLGIGAATTLENDKKK